jgi:hypothetical protein
MNIVNIRGPKRIGKITATTAALQLILPADVHRIELRFKNIEATNPVYLSNGSIELMDTTAAAITVSGVTLTNTTASTLAVNDIVRVEDELMLVTALPTSTTSTVTRGYLSTTAVAHVTALTLWAKRAHVTANVTYGYKLAGGGELIDLSSSDAWYVLSTGGNADVEWEVVTK